MRWDERKKQTKQRMSKWPACEKIPIEQFERDSKLEEFSNQLTPSVENMNAMTVLQYMKCSICTHGTSDQHTQVSCDNQSLVKVTANPITKQAMHPVGKWLAARHHQSLLRYVFCCCYNMKWYPSNIMNLFALKDITLQCHCFPSFLPLITFFLVLVSLLDHLFPRLLLLFFAW